MKSGIQTFLAEAGESACYALCLIEIAERVMGSKVYPMAALEDAIERGLIHYGGAGDDENFFVIRPDVFLSRMTGRPWAIAKAAPDYAPRSGEWVVDRWERKQTGMVTGHFRLPDWDSLEDSQTVKHGKIVSRRVFWVMA